MSILCRIGLHNYPHWVNAHTQATAPIRCERCGRKMR
jgi:DNA-directed RNA polymerase subunit RPC12/RpoP